MRTIELDGRKMDTRSLAHRHIALQLGFPAHYGNNLDALNDCLGELAGVRVVLRFPQAMLNALGAYGQRLLDVFRDATRGRDDLRFTVEGE